MVVGANLNATDVLVDAGIMGAATLGSDIVHNVIGMVPTTASSALVSGSFYAGAQKAYRDDSNYVVNLVADAATWTTLATCTMLAVRWVRWRMVVTGLCCQWRITTGVMWFLDFTPCLGV